MAKQDRRYYEGASEFEVTDDFEVFKKRIAAGYELASQWDEVKSETTAKGVVTNTRHIFLTAKFPPRPEFTSPPRSFGGAGYNNTGMQSKEVKCFKCGKPLVIKFVDGRKQYLNPDGSKHPFHPK